MTADLMENIIPQTLLKEFNANSVTLSTKDTTTIELLNKIDAYTSRYNQLIELFQKGFINLSRANYASHRTYDSTYYDERGFNATTIINTTGDACEVIDITKVLKDTAKENQIKKKEEEFEVSETKLKNRSKKSNNSDNSVCTFELPEDLDKYLDPIKMFGTLVPYQLKESQKNFKSLLPIALELTRIKTEIKQLSEKLELA